MGMYAVDTADAAVLSELRDAAGGGRAAAMARRRALSAGRTALTTLRVVADQPAPGGNAEVNAPPASVSDAHLGRTLSLQRRRQLSQGKAALMSSAGQTEGVPTNGGSSDVGVLANAKTAAPAASVSDAHLGRTLSLQRRRQLSQGKAALMSSAGQTEGVPTKTAAPAASVSDAHLGRVLSLQRRRQLSQGKAALMSSAGQTEGVPTNGGSSDVGVVANAKTAAPAASVSDAHLGRVLSLQRRRQLSQGKQALGWAGEPPESSQTHADETVAIRLQREERLLVTGLKLGAGAQITGDEAGRGLPVSGSQYVPADGSRMTPVAGPKVGLVRTANGLVVSGSTVRNRVAVTGDEFGEHLLITGEADQKLDDDLTPRRDDTYRAAQFPRRADPHGTSAVGRQSGRRLSASASSGDEPMRPLETSVGGRGITGTAVGRSGRVSGNEAGACRMLTGDQYQGLASGSSECGGTGGGTAPGAHLSRPRLDPVTGRKVTESQTRGGQRVTGPDVEHRIDVTGDELCRPVTGTAYQGTSSAFDRGEPDEDKSDAQGPVAQAEGVAVTGNVPLYADAVTGAERGRHSSVTGTPYHQNMRAAEPVNGGWSDAPGFPVAMARPGVRGQADVSAQGSDSGSPAASAPASGAPGQITGSFAIAQGKVTGNNEFLPRRGPDREPRPPVVTGEGSVAGRTVTGSAWTVNDRVTGTVAAGRNPSEGGGGSHGWAGAGKFREQGRTQTPRTHLSGHSGSSEKLGAKVTLSGGAQA